MDQKETIWHNINNVFGRIETSAKKAGRNPETIDLIAVTKQKPAVVVKILAEYGIKQIGESYLKEALFKMDLLKDFQIDWHMIGTIQDGKEKEIAARFDEVHSVGSKDTALKLSEYAIYFERHLPLFLEYNVSGEETKHGWKAWNQDRWPELIPDLEEILSLPNIEVKGLMTMAPYSEDPQRARPYFKKLRKLRDYLSRQFPAANLYDLSMGMSGDFEVAIEEGATVLRIGSALVGPR